MEGWKKLVLFGCAVVLGMTVAASAQSLESNLETFGCLGGDNCGACCLPNGNCIEEDEDSCIAQGGNYQGDDTFCSAVEQGAMGVMCSRNDTCENAILLPTLPITVEGGTINATSDDVQNCISLTEESGFAPGVWYSVIGTGEVLAATVCPFTGTTGDMDALVSVYCTCNAMQCVASGVSNCTEGGGAAEWCSEPGVEYKILVQTDGFEGVFSLTVETLECLVECVPEETCGFQSCGADHCSDAGPVCPGETYLVDTFGATSDYLDHGGTIADVFFCGPFFGVYDVWCKYTPIEDGLLFVHVEGPSGDGTEWVFGVYDGCNESPVVGDEPNLLECNTAVHHGVIVLEVEALRTYWIRSAARNFGRGEFILDIVGPPCANGLPGEAQGPDPCVLDVTGDGVVDTSDLVKVLRDATPCADPGDCPSDVTGDGTVDAKDVTSVLARLGSVCEPASKGAVH